MLDLGFQGKTRPVVIVSARIQRAPGHFPFLFAIGHTESRGGKYGSHHAARAVAQTPILRQRVGMGAAEWHDVDRPARTVRRRDHNENQRRHSLDAGSLASDSSGLWSTKLLNRRISGFQHFSFSAFQRVDFCVFRTTIHEVLFPAPIVRAA